MNKIPKKSLDGICRACFGAEKELLPICDMTHRGVPYLKIYEECIGQILEEYTNYPLLMCRLCQEDLLKVYEFRKICLETEEKIKVLQADRQSSEDPLLVEIVEVKQELEELDGTEFQNEEDVKEEEVEERPIQTRRYQTRASKTNKIDQAPKYCCEICKKLYPNRNSVNAHRWHAHKQRPPVMPCKRCGGTFKNREEKNGHNCIRKCNHCNKNIRGKHFAMHLMRHTNTQKNFTCKLCSKSYNTPADLAKHKLSSHKNTNTTLCMVCGKMVREKHLHMHLKTHEPKLEPKRTYPCSECSKIYSQSASLRSHMDSVHLGIDVHKLQCPHCEMRFKGHSNRTAHIYKFHLKKPLFTCMHCQKDFYHKSHYITHTKVHHSFEKLFHCKICGKAFALDTRRKVHEALHSEERPYTCANCSKSFKMKNHLIRHMRGHTGEKIFTCPHCSNLFYSIRSVRGHVKRDHPDKSVPPPGTILSIFKLEKMAKQQKFEETLRSIPVDPLLLPTSIKVKLQSNEEALNLPLENA
ncbi:zinc finger protein 25-like [Lutzomyia longipalpis]|uniref:zinc finger protein 25-like n=1 Tax=Lutzomyia longipalpis TaxID=7200 RepID=UPI002483B2F8|nr:zinc finger protein 25-like [Lutzomyia longipalpis]